MMALALHNAAPLKPEIRLAQTLSEYEAILTEDQKAKFRIYHSQQPPNTTDVMRFTAEIDRENSHRKSRRCVGPRLTSILQAVQQFSSIVDTIIGGSQSQIASAIWGVIKLTFQVTSSFSSYFDNLSKLFMNIGCTCPRYQDFGFLFPRSTRLQKVLCEYFVVIIELCKQAVLFIRKSFPSQLTSSILKPFQSEFGSFEMQLGRLANEIHEEASLASKQEQRLETRESSAFRTLAKKISKDVSRDLQEAKKYKSRKVKSQFLDGCSTYNHQTAWKQARKSGTSNWIYSTEGYRRWVQEPASSILWCTGILGSGKTVLSANIVENLTTTVSASAVSYFFCKHDEAESLKARTIIGSLARQLLTCVKPEAFDSFDPILARWLDTDRILEYLRKFLPTENQHYFVLIDGLDECKDIELKSVTQHLKDLLTSTHVFHLYCSSRPDAYREVSAYLQPCYNLSMSEARAELEQYIQGELEQRLKSDSLCLGDPAIILIIQDALVKGSQGMFLWVAFQLDSICSEATDEDILKSLESLPKDLPETFNRILRKLDQRKAANPSLRKKIFELVAAAQRPLTLEEFRDAISVIPGNTTWNVKRLVNDMRKTLDCCGSLLVIDEEHSTVHFAHHSVKQHLLSQVEDRSTEQYHVSILEADSSLGEICVTYLNFEVFNTQLIRMKTVRPVQAIDVPSAILGRNLSGSRIVNNLALKLFKGEGHTKYDISTQLQKAAGEASNKTRQEYSFLSYAQKYWAFHSKRFEPTTQTSYPLFRRLVSAEMSIVRKPWEGADDAEEGNSKREPLWWAIENGHEAVVKLLLARASVEINSKDGEGRTPLLWAAVNGHETVIRLLLTRADVEVNSKDYYGRTSLSWAAVNGHETIIKLLLTRADVEINSKDGNDQTLLWWAMINGHETIFKLLLARADVEINSKDGEGRTPLSWAAVNGHETVIRLLLTQANVEVNSKDYHVRTPFSWAAVNGHEAVIRLLLTRADVEVDSQDREGRTPLSWAAKNGHEAVIKLLLARADVEIDSKDNYGQTPLSWAAVNGHETVVRLLLTRADVEIDSKDRRGRTPLSWAAIHGHETVVKLLLARADVEVDSKDNYGQMPLSWAAIHGHEAVVKLLLAQADVEVDSKDNYGQTPLSKAAVNGHEVVVKLLLMRANVEADSKDRRGRTPLSWAAVNGHETVVRLLLTRADVEIDSKDREGRTPLSWAAINGHEAVVQLLLARADVEVDSKDRGDWTPLSKAAVNGHEAVVRLLLARTDVEINSKDMEGQTPLSKAAVNGHEKVVKLLLARADVKIDLKDGEDQTPLSRAAENGHEAVVRLLLTQADVEINSKDGEDQTPLSRAAENGHEAVVRLLLTQADVEINSKDGKGRTPLSWAAFNGHDAVISLLHSHECNTKRSNTRIIR